MLGVLTNVRLEPHERLIAVVATILAHDGRDGVSSVEVAKRTGLEHDAVCDALLRVGVGDDAPFAVTEVTS